MNDNTTPETSNAYRDYLDEHRHLWDSAVTTLTAAVRLTHPTNGPADFGDFLASALAAVAGNVGSLERVTAGRPGSWEASTIQDLLEGAVGFEPDALMANRTEPVIVRLNVPQLVNERRAEAPPEWGVPADYPEALDAMPGPGTPDREPTETEEASYEEAATQLHEHYVESFEDYARQFRDAVAEDVLRRPQLTAPVEVRAVTDPDATWWRDEDTKNSDEWNEQDDIARQLWASVVARIGLPTMTQHDLTVHDIEHHTPEPNPLDGI